ncbi:MULTISPECIES: TIGR00266 family protein [Enterococcus]|uniref:TIGR00266 family protein n=1 Tax=Enterococcus alishanensis TaxID=1303817 RepID=A0ABS6TD47_9ENTE|nr:TIGR00266 family protein [Enterococcus alishanensis]MBV7390843.1 TIGR00266 family protein [Enterococcus alishanensis]
MKYEISESAFAPIAKIELAQNEQIRIEPGAMVYELGEIELEGSMNANGKKGLGGALSAIGRSVSSGESFFISTATGISATSTIAIAPGTPGKIIPLDVGQEHWRLNTGAFLASEQSVSYNMKRQKLSGALLGGTGGLFVMETAGSGVILVSAFGDLEKIQVTPDAPVIVDNQHVIAWTSSLDYNIRVASGMFGFKTGEGIVNEFHGNGTIYIQTRNVQAFATQMAGFSSNS